MGMLWDIVQRHIDNAPYPPSIRQIAARLGVSPQTVTNWKAPKDLPARDNLIALAELTGRPYEEILEAALHDTGYRDPVTTKVVAVRTPQQIRRDLAAALINRAELDSLLDVPATQGLKDEQDQRITDLEAELAAAEQARSATSG